VAKSVQPKVQQQLDLFGAMPEAPSAPATTAPATDSPTPAKAPPPTEPVVYADNQIVVKVKKAAPANAEKPAVPAAPARQTPKSVQKEPKRGRKSFKEIDATADLIDVPDDQILSQKLYYSISEVAGWFKVNTSLLRYWENEFDILQPRKTRKGDRLFRVEDIKNLQLIHFLLRQRKFSIEGAKAYLKSNKEKIDTETRLVQTLTGLKQFLLELRTSLQ
jgi:DNA-binding transcriptional MerR regulator